MDPEKIQGYTGREMTSKNFWSKEMHNNDAEKKVGDLLTDWRKRERSINKNWKSYEREKGGNLCR